MKAKNSKARRNSFLKFFLLFLVTTSLIVGALYFDFNVLPFKDNETLRKQAQNVKREMRFQEEFSNELKGLRGMIDSLDMDKDGTNVPFINTILRNEIAKLQSDIPIKDSTYRYEMYNNMIWSYAEIQKLKGQVRSYEDVEKRITEFETALKECRSDLVQEQRTTDALRNALNNCN